jgi:hypothetical protein
MAEEQFHRNLSGIKDRGVKPAWPASPFFHFQPGVNNAETNAA